MKTDQKFAALALGTCSALALMLAQPAQAADEGPYISFDVGANLLQDVTQTFPTDGNVSSKRSFDTGLRFDMIGGYNLNSWAALEFETGFLENEMEHSSSAWWGAVPLLANVVFRYENSTKFVPYIGAGAGGAISMVGDSSGSDSDAVFAYQAKAGVAYKVEENMMVDVGYKFFSTDEQTYNLGMPFKLSDIYNHFIGASFTWKF